jgi:voltage-gated potassium channel
MGLLAMRRALHAQLNTEVRAKGLSPLNVILVVVIVAAVASAILETEATVTQGREALFQTAEMVFAIIFAAEYAARFWTAADNAKLGGGWKARWRWVVSPAALIDLVALLPALVAGYGPAYLLRGVRLLRMLRLAKLGRLSKAWKLLAETVSNRRYELMLTAFAAVFVVLVSGTALYLAEGPHQPDKFGSIPRALWWSVVTLTTIGYGDVFPVTPLGKVLTAMTAMIGIGLIAMPAGILAASMSDTIQRYREAEQSED